MKSPVRIAFVLAAALLAGAWLALRMQNDRLRAALAGEGAAAPEGVP